MKIDIFAGELGATLVARIQPLAKMLGVYGVDCKVIVPINWARITKGKLASIFSIILTHSPKEYVQTMADPPDAVIIGRVSTPQVYLFEKFLKNEGVKVIFDLDDPLFLPTSKLFGVNVRAGSFFLEKIVKSADYITVVSHLILNYVKSFTQNVELIHVPVDTTLFSPKIKSFHEKLTIGWEGDPKVHYQNLGMLIYPLKKLAKRYDIRFKIVSYLGDIRIKRMFNELERLMEVDYGLKSWVPLPEFAKLMSDFDIMVAPLQKTWWYEGKSILRVGIGMALGIPVVASAVGEQKYVIKHGINGYLAKHEEDWYNYLKILIEDESLRESMGREGRRTAENLFSLDACGRKLFNIINTLFK